MATPWTPAADLMTANDRADLRRLAQRLRPAQHDIAERWSQRLIQILPAYFAGRTVSGDQLTALNEAFLVLVLNHLERDDLSALYEMYYASNRQLVDADLQRAPASRISLASLHMSARVSLQIIEEYLGDTDRGLLLAYTKLLAELMMILGQAYSDTREDYLQRAFEQINTLSHELKAPLANLFGYLELLHAGDFGPVSPQQEEVLQQLTHECDDLLWLLTGTLDLSRIEAGRLAVHVEEFALDGVISDVLKNTPHLDTPITCTVPPDLPTLRTDRVKVKQIVSNLVRNAVRYGAKTPVTVTVKTPHAGVVEVSVRDHGPGIKPVDLQIIFDFFERGHSAQLARDGYGIGLHVVRRLVEMLGGGIVVESTPGAGSCFRFTLPVQAAPSPSP